MDFARGVLDADRKSLIENHLEANCATCRDSGAFWKAVVNLASDVRETDPPADALALVKEAYSLAKGPKPTAPWMLQFAELMFDSFRSTAPAGVRSHIRGPRHSIHRTGECVIELQIDSGNGGGRIGLTGQVLDANHTATGLGGTRVTVMRKGGVAAETVANAFGEFTLDCGRESALWILFEAPERLPVAIRMPDIAD